MTPSRAIAFAGYAGAAFALGLSIAQAAEENAPRSASVVDYALPLVGLSIIALVWWLGWRRAIRSPKRGLTRAVARARRFNEQTRNMTFPRPTPDADDGEWVIRDGISPVGAPSDSAVRSAPTRHSNDEVRLDDVARDAMARVERLRSEPDGKNPVADYFRLDAIVRRYLVERHHVKPYGVTVGELLDALPQELTSGVGDFAGEILRVCSLAQLRRFRPSRSELQRLLELADAMILADARLLPDSGALAPLRQPTDAS